MLERVELESIAEARVQDAEALYEAGRYDGAIYLCGYGIEVALKARICRTLGWSGYPSTKSEFQNYQSFRTHDLDVLLRLSGLEVKVKTRFLADWSIVAAWDPEIRYKPIGTAKKKDAESMIGSSKVLLGAL